MRACERGAGVVGRESGVVDLSGKAKQGECKQANTLDIIAGVVERHMRARSEHVAEVAVLDVGEVQERLSPKHTSAPRTNNLIEK